MAVKKSELYRSLWESADQLRGGMDASQYKNYVLVLLFVKYVSDKYAGIPYADVVVPDGGSFSDMVRLRGTKNIGEGINIILGKLADANNLRGIIDVADFNDADMLGDGQEMQDRLSNLIAIFENPALDFRRNRAEGDDLLGDAYEYLMRHFATESGKSKGQFYTPAEVSTVMARVIGIHKIPKRPNGKKVQVTIYDMTCGSGSLLLRAAAAAPDHVTVSLYGQEKDNATYFIARMNMILHGQAAAVIERGDTLATPRFMDGEALKRFDYAVANPPFSSKAWSNGVNTIEDVFERFIFGTPPRKNGDYAFLQHMLRSLNSTGKAAIILPHGVLFRGNSEAIIRRNIVERGYIRGIIGLPPNLFYGTGIPACIIVLDKEGAGKERPIFMIDASRGFRKDGNKNRLRHQDIHRIVDVFNRQEDVQRYSRLVPYSEIEANDFNLNIPRYIDTSDPEDLHDIEAHLRGGIPDSDIEALDRYWTVFPTLKGQLFEPADRSGYSYLVGSPANIRRTIYNHREFQGYTSRMRADFDTWKTAHTPQMQAIKTGDRANVLIDTISEALLVRFGTDTLLDKYDVYQRLMTYWADVMQDDVTLLVVEGWQSAARLREIVKPPKKKKGEGDDQKKEGEKKEKPDLVVGKKEYKAEVIPIELVIRRYFAREQAAIDDLTAQIDALTAEIDQLDEEHSGEDGLLAEARTEKGKLTATEVKKRLKAIGDDADYADEAALLTQVTALFDKRSRLDKQRKDAQATLSEQVFIKYSALPEEEIKTLVVDDKWLATLTTEIGAELERVSGALATRVRQLADRYAAPLPELEATAHALRGKVDAHLKAMGFTWG